MNKKDGQNNHTTSRLALGLCLGLAIGTAIGSATDKLGLWMSIGPAVGLVFGLLTGHRSDAEDELPRDGGDTEGEGDEFNSDD